MALLENKVIKVIKDAEATTIQVYSSPSDIKQADGYTIFPVVLNDGTTVYAQAVQSTIEAAGKTPLYYYPEDGVISYQLMNKAAVATLWAVVIFPGEGQTIHCYTPNKTDPERVDHTTSFLIEDGGTYDAEVVVDNPDLYLPGDLTITEGGDKIQKTINVIIGNQPSDGTSLTISPSTFNISYDTRAEAIPSAEFDLSTLENISSNSTNVNITLSSGDGSEFEGDLKVLSDGISPSGTTCTFYGFKIPVTLNDVVSSTNGEWSGSYSFIARGMIEGYSTLSFDCSAISKKKIMARLAYYAEYHIPNYQTVSEIPRENIDYLSSGLKTDDIASMFQGCENLLSIDFDSFNIDTSECQYSLNMFDSCIALRTLAINNIDTSNVIDMSYMFRNCQSLKTLSVPFNTSKVINMEYMFSGCASLTTLDLSSFDTSNVEDISSMFEGCNSLTEIKGIIDLKSIRYNISGLNQAFSCPISSSTPVQIKNPPSASNWWKNAGFASQDQFVIVP